MHTALSHSHFMSKRVVKLLHGQTAASLSLHAWSGQKYMLGID
jgi:hypothetical protein